MKKIIKYGKYVIVILIIAVTTTLVIINNQNNKEEIIEEPIEQVEIKEEPKEEIKKIKVDINGDSKLVTPECIKNNYFK